MNMEQMRRGHINGCNFVIILCVVGLFVFSMIGMVLGVFLSAFIGIMGYVIAFIPDILIIVPLIYNIGEKQRYISMQLPQEFSDTKIETHRFRKLSEEHISKICSKFYALDLETTGLNPENSEIIQLALVEFSNETITRSFTTFVKPYFSIPEAATKINNITNSMVSEAPGILDVLSEMQLFAPELFDGSVPCVAHNAKFDISFLERYLKYRQNSVTINYIDTLEQSRHFIEHSSDYKLQTLARILNLTVADAHRADSDAITCGQLLLKLIPYAQKAADEENARKAKTKSAEEAEMVSAFLSLSDEEKKALLSKNQ